MWLSSNAIRFSVGGAAAKIVPPLFNSYKSGQTTARTSTSHPTGDGTPHRVRTDLSATLFLAHLTIMRAVNWSLPTPLAHTG
jgi:PKHD-type hydroxylase